MNRIESPLNRKISRMVDFYDFHRHFDVAEGHSRWDIKRIVSCTEHIYIKNINFPFYVQGSLY